MMRTFTRTGALILLVLLVISPLHVDAQNIGIDQLPATMTLINRGKTALNFVPAVPTNDKSNAKDLGISVLGVTIPISWNQLALTLAKTVVNQVVDSTAAWMASGFDKDHNPAFVVEPWRYFGNIGNGVLGDELNKLSKGVLCSPFQAKVVIAIRNANIGNTGYSPQCKLTGIVKNFDNFVKSFNGFSDGGWNAFFAITQNSGNNPYGAFIDAQLQISNKVAVSVNSASKELDWGSGFKSQKECKKYNTSVEDVRKWLEAHPNDTSDPPGFDRDHAPGACLEYGPILTPGATLKSHLDEALPANVFLRQLTTADQFNKILTALGSGLLQRFVTGPKGLLGSKAVKAGGSDDDSGSVEPTSPVTCSASVTRATAKEDVVVWNATTAYDADTVTTFVWSDKTSPTDGNLTGKKGASATTTYFTKGIKQAAVTASSTKLDELGNPIPNSHIERTYTCSNTVTVSLNHPLQVSCVASTPRITIPIGVDKSEPVTYTATITGGSGKYTVIKWDGQQAVPPTTSGLANAIFPYELSEAQTNATTTTWCYGNTPTGTGHMGTLCDAYYKQYGLKGNAMRTGVTLQTLFKDATSSTPTLPVYTASLSRIYFRDKDNLGSVNTTITIFDDDVLLEPVTKKECPVTPIPVLDY